MEMEQQRQQLHRGISDAIARLEDPRFWKERHKLKINNNPVVDRQSLEHIVDFLDTGTHSVTELELSHILDGWDVLRTYFARSDISLTKVTLNCCYFDTQEDAMQLLSAFQTNRTITDLRIPSTLDVLQPVALGNSLSGLLQNMPQLQKLACTYCRLDVGGVRAFQPGLQVNQNLRELDLGHCYIGDGGVRLLADALAGNETIEILDLAGNDMTSNGLDDITRLLESTWIQKINLKLNHGFFNNENANQRFAAKLHNNTTMQELEADWGWMSGRVQRNLDELENAVNTICARNMSLNHVDLLLATPLPPQQPQQPPQPGGTMTFFIKTWHKAITKFAMVGPSGRNAGASAIFKLFRARPQLLEKRIKRPATASTAAAVVDVSQKHKRQRM